MTGVLEDITLTDVFLLLEQILTFIADAAESDPVVRVGLILCIHITVAALLFSVFSSDLLCGLAAFSLIPTDIIVAVTLSRTISSGLGSFLVLIFPIVVTVVIVTFVVFIILTAVLSFYTGLIYNAIFGDRRGYANETDESRGDVEGALFTVKPPDLFGRYGYNFGSWSFSLPDPEEKSTQAEGDNGR